jgi:hypothetical protein
MRIQTFGLLADIKKRVYAKGDDTVSWAELEAFAAPMKVKNLPGVLRNWAEENMIWVEFKYDEDRPASEQQITRVVFGASK